MKTRESKRFASTGSKTYAVRKIIVSTCTDMLKIKSQFVSFSKKMDIAINRTHSACTDTLLNQSQALLKSSSFVLITSEASVNWAELTASFTTDPSTSIKKFAPTTFLVFVQRDQTAS